jgi:hypothetical protein
LSFPSLLGCRNQVCIELVALFLLLCIKAFASCLAMCLSQKKHLALRSIDFICSLFFQFHLF